MFNYIIAWSIIYLNILAQNVNRESKKEKWNKYMFDKAIWYKSLRASFTKYISDLYHSADLNKSSSFTLGSSDLYNSARTHYTHILSHIHWCLPPLQYITLAPRHTNLFSLKNVFIYIKSCYYLYIIYFMVGNWTFDPRFVSWAAWRWSILADHFRTMIKTG